MKKMKYQNVKGTKDYLPADEMIRSKVKRTLEEVFIQYGCKPIETPILNYTKLMTSKYGGGAEILEEMYTLTDRGERDLALRYDLTIPFTKVIAMNPSLPMPFKRYEIGKVFRDGPIKTGRLREFVQADVDVIGVESQIAEAELMMIALDVFRKLNMNVVIQYNNRKLLAGMLETFGVGNDKINPVILILDKLAKVGLNAVLRELREQNLPGTTVALLQTFLTDDECAALDYFEPYAKENEQIKQGLAEMKELQSYLEYLSIQEECVFTPFLARGLEIYTSTIYEVFLAEGTITSSIGSGGRYDNAVAGLIGTDESFPTAGISFGVDVIYTALQNQQLVEQHNDAVDYYIIPIGKEKQALRVARDLRNKGYTVETELGNTKLNKALKKANREGINKVIFIGEEEIEKNMIKIKDMVSGNETTYAFNF